MVQSSKGSDSAFPMRIVSLRICNTVRLLLKSNWQGKYFLVLNQLCQMSFHLNAAYYVAVFTELKSSIILIAKTFDKRKHSGGIAFTCVPSVTFGLHL